MGAVSTAIRPRLRWGDDRARTRDGSGGRRGLRSTEILIAITVLAGVLRLATVNVQSVWLDEAATMHLVHRGLGGMLTHLSSSESTPPLYYILVWAWTRVFGPGPIAFRSFSVLVGTATVPVVYAAGRRISVRAGLWSAALAALCPIMLYYSQEARAYGLLILLSTAAFVQWQRVLEDRSRRGLVAWTLLSIAALLTHYFAVFPLIPEAMILVVRLGWRRLIAPVGALLAVGAALLPLVISQRSSALTNWITSSSLASRFAQVPKDFLIGLYSPLELFSAALACLLAAAALVLLWRRSDERQQRLAFDIAIVGVVALVVPGLLAITHLIDVFNGRNALEVWTPWAVLIAGGVAADRAKWLGPSIGVALCAISVAVIAGTEATSAYQRDDWRGAAQSLRQFSAENRVVVTDKGGTIALSIYLPSLRDIKTESVMTREVDFVTLRTPRTARTPAPPAPPGMPLVGFSPAPGSRTSTYAVYRFVARVPTSESVAVLRRVEGDPAGDITLLP
jgi:uncharacterized membrane protein